MRMPASAVIANPRTITVRGVLQCAFFVVLGYGSDWDAANDAFYPKALENMISVGVSIDQVLLVVIGCAAVVMSAAQHDHPFRRNPLHTAMGLLVGLFIVSFLRMVLAEGGFRLPYEFITMTFYLAYVVATLLFDAEETPLLFGALLACAALKSVEASAAWLVQRSAEDSWGSVTLWRDGYFLSIYVTAWLVMVAHRADVPRGLFVAATVMLFFVAISAVTSIRRSFLLSIPFAAVPVFFALRSGARRRLAAAFLAVLAIGLIAALWTGFTRFADRLAIIGNPLEEHSAAYRVWEFLNVRLTIMESPWVGYPMGVPWKIHGAFPFPVLSPLASHNTYMNFMLRGGVFGVGLFLWFAVVLFRVIIRSIRRARHAIDTVIAVSLLAWAAIFFIASNTAPILSEPRGATLVGVMVALAALQYERVVLRADQRST